MEDENKRKVGVYLVELVERYVLVDGSTGQVEEKEEQIKDKE